MALREYIIKKFSGFRMFGGLAAFLTVLTGLHMVYGWVVDGDNTGAILWASSAALALFALSGILNYCVFEQMKMQDEIDRMSRSRERLERALLSDRLSSDMPGRDTT